MTASIVLADASHIPALAAGMRQADRDECWAWALHTPEEALRVSLDASALAWTGMLDDKPVCMFGAGGALLAPSASPWLLGTDAVDLIPMTFARMSRVALRRMAACWPHLANWTDERHVRSHAWLFWLGFTFGPAQPMGPLGLPFRPFSMGTRDV